MSLVIRIKVIPLNKVIIRFEKLVLVLTMVICFLLLFLLLIENKEKLMQELANMSFYMLEKIENKVISNNLLFEFHENSSGKDTASKDYLIELKNSSTDMEIVNIPHPTITKIELDDSSSMMPNPSKRHLGETKLL